MHEVKFKYEDESKVCPKLIEAINNLCEDKQKDCLCTSGYRSLEKQKIINAQKLVESTGNYQTSTGAVYDYKGQCIAAAYGNSMHNYCIAMDITDDWFKKMTNSSLYKYGLFKPISYEPWHVILLDHSNLTQTEKETIRDSVLGTNIMSVKEFQSLTGLVVDGITGPKTQAKAKEILKACQKILKNDFSNAGEVIVATQNSPAMWMEKRGTIKYFDDFIMNIVKRMGGLD